MKPALGCVRSLHRARNGSWKALGMHEARIGSDSLTLELINSELSALDLSAALEVELSA